MALDLAHETSEVVAQGVLRIEARGCGRANLARKLCELLGLHPHDLAWPVSGVHQASNQSQPLDLLNRIVPLPEMVPQRGWKPIAPLPHTQGVLRQAGVAFNCGNAQVDGLYDSSAVVGVSHGVHLR